MLCIAAFIIFSLLGIFSATHRQLAGEALDCVLRRVTFRPCNTGFNEKIKGRVLSFLLNRSTFAAKLFNKHFEFFSWIFVLLMVGSTVWVIWGGVNFYLYGNCNGEESAGFCIFDPAGSNNKISGQESCSGGVAKPEDIKIEKINLAEFPKISTDSKDQMIFIACYGCDYSRSVYPTIKKILEEKNPNFTFIHFPVKSDTYYLSKYDFCAYQQNKENFWKLNDSFFTAQKEKLGDESYIKKLVVDAGYDIKKIDQCIADPDTKKEVDRLYQEIENAKVYGTPTVLINNELIVGPKPYRVYNRLFE